MYCRKLTEEGIELARGNADLPGVESHAHGTGQPIRVLLRRNRKVDALSPLDLHKAAVHFTIEFAVSMLVNEVPFVAHGDESAPGTGRLLYHPDVLLGQGLEDIDENEGQLDLAQYVTRAQ